MKKTILISLILLAVFVEISSEINERKNVRPRQINRMRTFNVFPNNFWHLRKAHTLKQSLKEEMERKELEEKNERLRIYQLHLRPQASNFQKDFHVNRFF